MTDVVQSPGIQGRDKESFVLSCRIDRGNWTKRQHVIAILLIVLGTAIRLLLCLANWTLWDDEAALAWNIIKLSPGEFFHQPLMAMTSPQAAPVGFLLMVKKVIEAFGASNYSLRLVPLVFGCAALPAFLLLSRRVLSPKAALIALTLMSILEFPVYWSTSLKQYSVDMFMTVLLLWLALRYSQEGRRLNNLIAFTLAAVVGVWFSHSSIFVAAAAIGAISLERFGAKDFLEHRGNVGLRACDRFELWDLLHGGGSRCGEIGVFPRILAIGLSTDSAARNS